MNSDIQELLEVVTYGTSPVYEGTALDVLGSSVFATAPALATGVSTATTATTDPAALAVEVKTLLEAITNQRVINAVAPKLSSSSATSDGPSTGETMLRTAATMTGVGPVVTGLLKLFGSSDPEPLPALEKFTAPTPVAVEAGLTSDRAFTGLRYGQGGTPTVDTAVRGSSQPTTIQVNVQAMDSRSFLDRQDDIARAVREAMLHSNSLNDVVLEL